MKGEWIHKPASEITVVFVHGILSNGETCWRHPSGTYWPELLKNETELSSLGIYVYTYETGFSSGSYSLSDVVDDLKERLFTVDHVADSKKIIFICHSMGGIVVRKLLVERVNDFLDRNVEIGLYLVASPSLGSDYANWLEPIAKCAGHAQAKALRFSQDNQWLNDLDKTFQNLKESGRLKIHGKELLEDKFVILKYFWRKQVVERFAGARYFGESYKVPDSDHFSIAKPQNKEAIQHRLLLEFIKNLDWAPSSSLGTQAWKLQLRETTEGVKISTSEQEQEVKSNMPSCELPNKFLVAFSFAGEQRKLVHSIAETLEHRLGKSSVFYDDWFEHYLAGDDADLKLQKIYREQCELVVVCVSERYGNKPWTQAEHTAIRARQMELKNSRVKGDEYRILPIRVGAGDIPGVLFNAIVPDVRQRPVADTANLIIKRLRLIVPESVTDINVVDDIPSETVRNTKELPDDGGGFAQKVRHEIKQLLTSGEPAALVLREVLQTTKPQVSSPEEILLPADSAISAETAIGEWLLAVQNSLQTARDHRGLIKQCAQKVMGWLVLLCVDSQRMRQQGVQVDLNDTTEIVVPVKTPAGTEVFIARLQERPANFRHKASDKALGEGYVDPDELELGLCKTDRLQQIKQLVYKEVFKKQPNLSEGWESRLRHTLEIDATLKKKMYYLTLPRVRHSEHLDTIKQLKNDLPHLRVLITSTNTDGDFSLLIIDEYRLEALILAFLNTLNEFQ